MKILKYKIDPELPYWLVDYTWEKIVIPLHENNYVGSLDPADVNFFSSIHYSHPNRPKHHHPRIVPHMIGQMLHTVIAKACINKLDIPVEIVDCDMFITIDEQTALIEYMKNC